SEPSKCTERPGSTRERRTRKQQRKNKRAGRGTAAKTGSRNKRRELRPRGPNQENKRRLRKSNWVPARETKKAMGRINTTATAKRNTGQLSTVNPLQINELPKRTKVKSRVISAVV